MTFSGLRSSTKHARLSGYGWKLATVSFVIIFLSFLFLGSRPTSSGQKLRDQAEIVEKFMASAMEKRRRPFEIRVVRDTWFSIVGHDLALFFIPQTMGDAKPSAVSLVKDLHAPGVLNAVSEKILGKCTVVVSGQGIGESFPMGGLFAELGDENLAWKVALLHESAHCLRNPASDRIENLKRLAWRESSPHSNQLFSLYLAEAYADAYSVLALANLDPFIDHEAIAQRLIALRQSASAGPYHRTEGAIRQAADLVKTREKSTAPWLPNELDRLAMQSALNGSSPWFRFMKIEPAQIAPGFVDSLRATSAKQQTPEGSLDV